MERARHWNPVLVIVTTLLCQVTGKSATLSLKPGQNLDCTKMNTEILVTLTTDTGETVDLILKKNEFVNPNTPLYTSRGGGIQKETLLKITNIAYYLDPDSKAAVQVTCWSPYGVEPFVQITGTLVIGDKPFVIEPIEDDQLSILSGANIEYTLKDPILPDFGDDAKDPEPEVTTEGPELPNGAIPEYGRHKRDSHTIQSYNVDILAVIDYLIYDEYFKASSMASAAQKREDALKKIRTYFAHIINSITMRYNDVDTTPPIVVRLAGYYVAETADDAVWTESIASYVPSLGYYTLDVDEAINKLVQWNNDTVGLPTNDHVMLFTRYDLSSKDSTGAVSVGVVGYAFLGTTCSVDSVSLIEESYDRFEGTSATAAHELGHNFNARHDGDQNICHKDEKFLMWPYLTDVNTYHVWYFSKCSIDYFEYFFAELAKKDYGYACLTDPYEHDDDVVDVSGTVHAASMTFEDQCEFNYGTGSTVCQGLTDVDTMCGLLYCSLPAYPGYCNGFYPALGSHCGPNSWCIGGQCVETTDPSIPDSPCPFGETSTDVYYSGMDCTEYMEKYDVTSCYDQTVRGECCETCWTHHTGVVGCEYGDKVKPCKKEYCDPALNETFSDGTPYSEMCCITCLSDGHTQLPDNVATSLTLPLGVCLCLQLIGQVVLNCYFG